MTDKLLANIDRDAESYEGVMAAYKLPKTTDEEKTTRAKAIEDASKHAAEVPLETARLATAILSIVESVRSTTIPQAASDLTVATHLAEAARAGAIENVRANLPSIQDSAWVQKMEAQVQSVLHLDK